MTWQGHFSRGSLTFIWDGDTFSIMELWWQMSRIIIPLFKSFFIQWTSSNIRVHSWRRNWKMLSVGKLEVQPTYHLVWLQARAWWGILERILLWTSLILFHIRYIYSLSCWNFCRPPLYHSSECRNDRDDKIYKDQLNGKQRNKKNGIF